MKHDPFYKGIIAGLNGQLDRDLFEACAVELIRDDGLIVVPIPGGNDAGMDGAIADSEGEPYPLVTTTGKNCIKNLSVNLKSYLNKGGKRRKVVFATSQALTTQKGRNLKKKASELGFTMIQLYEQSAIAARLYRNSSWCKELLQLNGNPFALSIIPLSRRPLLNHDLIGREEAQVWLENTKGDKLLAGEPGSGKTAFLYRFTRSQPALFVVSKDLGRIANAIREQQPQYIIFDDAHVDPDFLVSIKHLREEIHAEFDLVATCWNGDAQTIADILSLPETHVHKLKRLSRQQMVDVIAEAGIRGVNWLVREIVTQSEGLPGIAVTLTRLCLQGSATRIQSAEALSSTILKFYVKRVESDVKDILASFALGGNAGMLKSVIARELNIPPSTLRRTLAELATGGVIAEVDFVPDSVKVRPAAFRHALIREVFFSGPAALSVGVLNNLLAETPDPIEVTRELIYVKARGGKVPDHLLQTRISALSTVWEIWNDYAWLGKSEANWVLDHFQGKVTRIAFAILTHIPQRAIPALISEAVGDNRLLSATPEHPLRRLEDWIKEARPGTGDAVKRRQLLLESAREWLLKKNDLTVGYRAILFALDPTFETHEYDPGSGNNVTMYFTHLTADELTRLKPIWYQILQMTEEILVTDWQPFIDVIHHWAYPHRNYTEDAGEVMRNFAKEMALSLAEQTKEQASVAHSLKRVLASLMPEFQVDIDPEIELLYPPKLLPENIEERERTWQTNVQSLARQWQNLSPEAIVQRLVEIEDEMNGASHSYPRLTPNLCYELAQLTDEPLQFVNAILLTDLSGDLLLPFLSRTISEKLRGWEQAVETCLDNRYLQATAIKVILKLEDPPGHLLQRALHLLSEYPELTTRLCLSPEIPKNLLPMLLKHPNALVVQAAALAEWMGAPQRSVRNWLRAEWEEAILNHCFDDYWLADIFKSEHHLAFPWLELKMKSNEFKDWRFNLAIPAATSVLNRSERLQLLDILPTRYGYHGIVAQIVGNDVDLFQELLRSERLKKFHLAPIAGDIDTVWKAMVKLALSAGYTEEEVVTRTIRPIGTVIMWSGNESDHWKKWLEKFNELQDSDDAPLRDVAVVGSMICQQAYESALEREQLEAVYGRD